MGKAARRKARTGRIAKPGKTAADVAAPDPSGRDWSAVQPAPKDPAAISYGVIDDGEGSGEQRSHARLAPRELGNVRIEMRMGGSETWLPLRLRDFTPIGFGALLESDPRAGGNLQDPLLGQGASPAAPRAAETCRLTEDDEVEIRLAVAAHQEFTVWCRVMNLSPARQGVQIGLRRLDIGFPQPVSQERRDAHRLSLTPALALEARLRHPFLYSRWCGVRVSDINGEMGLSLTSADPTILVFEGMELDLHFELAGFRAFPMSVRVAWVYAGAEDELRFGVQCRSVDLRLHNALCDYLLNTQYWTPARLRQAGFQSRQVKGHLRYTTVKTLEDYAEVLYLRRDSYVGVGKRPQGTRPEKMSSPLDGRSRIMMASHHGRLVGTMTLTFPASEDTVLDTQSGFPGARYPVHLPPKTNLIEVARLCIDENYRGTDLLIGMFEHGLKHFLMSDRHWLVTSATDELWPLYERLGFVKLKASYRHPLLNNLEHHLIIAHRSAFLWGWGIGLLTWNSVFADLVKHVLGRKLMAVPGWMRLIIRAKLALRPLARLLTDARARAGFRRHMRALQGRRAEAASAPLTPTERAGGSLYSEVGSGPTLPGKAEGPEAD